MERLGFYYDPTRCTGCRTCQMACKEKKKSAAGEFCRRVDTIETEGKWMHFSLSCNHCADPACVAVCPGGAMYKAEDGTVQHRDDLCIGCGRCAQSCPYGAVFIGKYSGYAVKCDACTMLRAEGKPPACVEACPMRALQFGDLNELESSRGAVSGAEFPFLPPERETYPNLIVRGAGNCGHRAPVKRMEVAASGDAFASESDARVVILGSGVAAVSAAKEIRRRNGTVSVTIISREERLPYARPMLSKGLTGSFAMDRYPLLAENWLEENAVSYIGSAEIVSLSTQAHTVTLSDGRVIPYDKCIYALGADCFAPPISGREKKGVFTLRYDRDLAAIREAMLRAENAVIIGGGITGLELAWELKKSGLTVTVLDVLEQLMDRFLDSEISHILRRKVESAGIYVRTGVQIRSIDGGERAERIVLSDGTEINAELVVLSTGYRPNIAIAKEAGLAAERAVLVSEKMETSDRDVYACGDCVDRSTATWMQSIEQGRIAAANVLGAARCFAADAEPVMVHTAGVALLMVGDMGKREKEGYRFLRGSWAADGTRFMVNPPAKEQDTTYVSLCFREGRLTGVTLLGSIALMLTAQKAVDECWDMNTARSEFTKRGVTFHEA